MGSKSGHADLPLHGGRVPRWLAERMTRLGGAVVESLVYHYGTSEVLTRLSDPFWFQALGCVMGMDWHSSGITTSVLGALKRSVNPKSHELGIYICGGRGKHSRRTPEELLDVSSKVGLDGDSLVRASRLTAKVDNNAIGDGFQIYLHSFVVSQDAQWVVVQQGMNEEVGMARRYHWHSESVRSFTEEPHKAIVGRHQGCITNLVDIEARRAQEGIREVLQENPDKMLREIKKLEMPRRHQVREPDINLKRLGAVLALAQETELRDFASVLLLQGLGPRTLQSLALVTEVIHGSQTRFSDPARFSFAHGGKDGEPFPVPTKVYDETIAVLENSLKLAKVGQSEKTYGLKRLHTFTTDVEKIFSPKANFNRVLAKERRESPHYGGRSVFDSVKKKKRGPKQLDLL